VIEGATGAGVQALGAGGPAFVRCLLRQNGGAGVEVASGASPRFSGGEVTGSGGAGLSVAEGASPVFEELISKDNGAPDELAGAAIARDPSDAPHMEPATLDEEGVFVMRYDMAQVLAAALAARGEAPPEELLGHALVTAVAHHCDSVENLDLHFDGATLTVRTPDRALAERARDALALLIREPTRLRAAVDFVALRSMVETLSAD
jgi:hypothetical protein